MICEGPVYVPMAGGLVPCGKCPPCLSDRARKRTLRLILENLSHEDVLFATLTYSDKFLPREIRCSATGSVLASHPSGCLDKRAVQLFLKRLRRNLPHGSLRYFVAGEYGEKRGRPHYHFLLWGLPYSGRHHIYDSWTDPNTRELMCDPDFIDVQVPKSISHVSRYCCSYILKSMRKKTDNRLDGRTPEFCSHSKGISKGAVDYLLKSLLSPSGLFHIETLGGLPYSVKFDGKSWPLDRYLRSKIADGMGIAEKLSELAQARFSEEMQFLFSRAKDNPEIPKRWILDERYYADVLVKQYLAENSQRIVDFNRRGEMFSSSKGDFNV